MDNKYNATSTKPEPVNPPTNWKIGTMYPQTSAVALMESNSKSKSV